MATSFLDRFNVKAPLTAPTPNRSPLSSGHQQKETMTVKYERSRRIDASPEDIFAFVSTIRNLQNFVPTVHSAEVVTEEHVRVQGKDGSTSYEDDGWLRADPAQRRLEWAVAERDYSGWMTISGVDEASEVITHLSIRPRVDDNRRPLTGESRETPDPTEEGLEAAMDSLRNLIEGRGGKEEPSTAT